MTIQIEEGKYYRRADGSVHGPARHNDEAKWDTASTGPYVFYPWSVGEQDYLNDGRFYLDHERHFNDLIAEVSNGSLLNDAHAVETVEGPQVAETPEWGAAVEAEAAIEAEANLKYARLRAGGASPEDAYRAIEIPPFLRHDIKAAIADEAKRIVSGARRSAYGKPEDNFERIARFWDAYFKNTGRDISITAADVSPLMRLMKEARLCETPDHYDSHVDLAGYTLTGAEVNKVVQPTKAA